MNAMMLEPRLQIPIHTETVIKKYRTLSGHNGFEFILNGQNQILMISKPKPNFLRVFSLILALYCSMRRNEVQDVGADTQRGSDRLILRAVIY